MNLCSCLKGRPGFHINVRSIDTKTLVISDLSEWMDDETYVVPEKFSVNIILPDNSEFSIELNARNSTILRASTMGIPKFKDGIYTFKIDGSLESSGGCGINYEKPVGIFPNLECCLMVGFSTLDDSKFNSLRDVDVWISAAKQSSELGKVQEAIKYWEVAKYSLDKLNCNCLNSC